MTTAAIADNFLHRWNAGNRLPIVLGNLATRLPVEMLPGESDEQGGRDCW
ncbi:MAG: hypothetical protein Q8L22_19185 [Reyranella sp.]|nr:hypothetical protein [Reyranella sp.]